MALREEGEVCVSKRKYAENSVIGTVAEVKECWWLTVNTKVVKTHSLDGAKFPHTVRFTYIVENIEYKGKKFFGAFSPYPQIGGKITVHYDINKPKKHV